MNGIFLLYQSVANKKLFQQTKAKNIIGLVLAQIIIMKFRYFAHSA